MRATAPLALIRLAMHALCNPIPIPISTDTALRARANAIALPDGSDISYLNDAVAKAADVATGVVNAAVEELFAERR